ncbi:MAG: peroxiredoxin, partial [Varibaculum sp.]
MSELTAGQKAPDFTLPTDQGTEVSLQGLLEESEKGAVVYFYPKASTPGCTTEACDFRDSLNSLKSAGYAVVGISPDKMPALEKFRDKQELNFPLASDPEREVMSSYGAYGEK